MKTQQRKGEIVMKGLLSLAVVVALAGGASAGIIAQHDGPTDFNGTSDYVTLADAPAPGIGDEGTLYIEFKVDTFPDPSSWANTEYLWCYKGSKLHRVFFGQEGPTSSTMMLKVFLNATSGYAVSEQIPFNDTTEWHTLQVAWKNSEETLITLDDTVYNVTNNGTLPVFTNYGSCHLLGAYRDSTTSTPVNYFDGQMRNVKVHDVFIPEPSTCVMLLAGALAIGLAWRRRLA